MALVRHRIRTRFVGVCYIVIMLTDNRIALSGVQLGYACYGDEHGLPVFYFHGLPGSRREAQMFHRACADHGVRLLAVDRPGYGLSAPIAASPLQRWPRLIAALADTLGIARFHVLGLSGGAPYALACASALHARVRGTALCGGLGEVCGVEQRLRMAIQARLGFRLAEYGAVWVRCVYGYAAAAAARSVPRAVLAAMTRLNPEPDRSVLQQPEMRALYVANLREAFRQGAVGGVADLCAVVRPWEFDLERVRALQLWHGTRDGIVPIEHSERLVARAPYAHLLRLEGEGHFSLPVRYADAIIRRLIAH